MEGFDARRYGVDWADIYDSFHEPLVDTAAGVDGLAGLIAPGAAVLEYGAGTGRLAIPLAERGFEVVAVDISEPMIARLHAKPGAEMVTTVLADMTEVALERTFDLAFIALNSIFALPSQEHQVRLFGNAALHLRPGGRFAVEAIVPAEQPLSRIDQMGDRVAITTGKRDPVTNTYTATWVLVGADGITVHPIGGRYVGHAELDLMARLAGLDLEHRWSDWKGAPFTAASRTHVSVYRRP